MQWISSILLLFAVSNLYANDTVVWNYSARNQSVPLVAQYDPQGFLAALSWNDKDLTILDADPDLHVAKYVETTPNDDMVLADYLFKIYRGRAYESLKLKLQDPETRRLFSVLQYPCLGDRNTAFLVLEDEMAADLYGYCLNQESLASGRK
tara:strand:- start:4964 stop:5416 length:453 start_codon:yes stop_codon:yes gene_type:complete